MKTVLLPLLAVLAILSSFLQSTHTQTDPVACANNGWAAEAGARPLQPLHGKLALVHLAEGHWAPSGAELYTHIYIFYTSCVI